MAQRDPLDSLDRRLNAVQRRIHERFDQRAAEVATAAEALAAGDGDALGRLRQIAHRLKGHTRDRQLLDAAATVERLAEEGDVEGTLAAVPALARAARSVASRSRSTPWPPQRAALGPERILVVDDDPTIRQVVSLTLARLGGYEVVVAGSGTEASALCETRSFDLAIIDRRLPGDDGLAFAEGMRDRGGAARIVIYSGSGPDECGDAMGGIDDWWKKPMGSKELVRAVREILEAPPRNGGFEPGA